MRVRPFLRILVNLRDSLASDLARECYIFMFFVAVSAGFWFIKTLQETYETELAVPLQLTNVPENVVITRSLPDTVYVKVRDRGTVIFGLRMQLRNQPLRISFSEFAAKPTVGSVAVENISKRISSHIGNATALMSVRPSTVFFAYNRGVSRRVPVRSTGSVTTHPQFKLQSITLRPDTITVYASQRQLDSLRCVNVDLTDCANLRRDSNFVVFLPKNGTVKYVPDTVNVHIAVDMYTEKKVRVPIIGTNFPANCHLRTFPATVEVTFRVGTHDYNKIKAEDFVLTVPYEELIKMREGSRWRVHASSLPEGASNPRFSPAEVEFLIEQSSAGD